MENATKLTLENLVPGDVLVMVGDLRASNPTRALTELITLLTDSDVSHSALFVGKAADGKYQLIDAALSGVGLTSIADNDNTDDPRYARWYVRRMAKPSLAPVVQSAESYIGRAVYDKAWLVMLGVLLVVENILPNGPKERLALQLLKHFFYAIDQRLNRGDNAHFVCSEYVAVAFKDAGSDYELTFKRGALVQKANPMDMLKRQFPALEAKALADDELAEVTRGLNLQEPALNLGASLGRSLEEDLLNDAAKLVVKLLKDTDLSTRTRLLRKAADYQSAFVTPACLKDDCKNLSDEGQITLGYGQ